MIPTMTGRQTLTATMKMMITYPSRCYLGSVRRRRRLPIGSLKWNSTVSCKFASHLKRRRLATFVAALPCNRTATQPCLSFVIPSHSLDESHRIRNGSTAVFKSCSALMSTRRLCITGTPFVNKPGDIQSLISFLNEGHITSNPLVDKKAFKAFVTRPIQQLKLVGLSRVRSQMGGE